MVLEHETGIIVDLLVRGGFLSSEGFTVVFSVGWGIVPCVGLLIACHFDFVTPREECFL